METEGKYENANEICKTEMEMEFFMRKRKQKRNGVFRWNRRGNRTFRFREYGISVSTIGPWLLCSPNTKENTMTQLVEWI